MKILIEDHSYSYSSDEPIRLHLTALQGIDGKI